MTYDEITEIMRKEFDPKKLAIEKARAYETYIIQILKDCEVVIPCLFSKIRSMEICDRTELYDFIGKYCFESQSGDYKGDENTVIDFGYGGNCMDIAQALTTIFSLYEFAYGKEDNSNANE